MLVYDWKTAADPERVVEDVERMESLDYYEWHDGDMLEEWNTMWDGWEYNYYRNYVTNKTDKLDMLDDIQSYEVPCYLPSQPELTFIEVYGLRWRSCTRTPRSTSSSWGA